MAKAGASQYTFHVEATHNVTDCIQRVKAANMKVRIFFSVTYWILLLSVCL